MLYMVVRDSYGRNEEQEHHWHVGEKLHSGLVESIEHGKCRLIQIQADSDELEYIRQNFKGLPDCTTARIVSWNGDLAQFIFDHLPQ